MKIFIRHFFVSLAFCFVLNISVSAQAQTASDNPTIASADDQNSAAGIQIPQPDPLMAQAEVPPPAPPTSGVQEPPPPPLAQPQAAPAPAEAAPPVVHEKAAKPAKTAHHKKKKAHAKKSKSAKMSTRERVRMAQTFLEELGYSPGTADGLLGRKTKNAIRGFQGDHHLKVTGTLTDKTFNLLRDEAKKKMEQMPSAEIAPPAPPTPEFYSKHADFYGYYGQDYANPVAFGSPQPIPTRFGDMQLADQQDGMMHQYVITLNGQPIFHAAGQPAVINLSRTFNLSGADVVVLTSYATGDNVCPYRHYILVVRVNSNGVHEIGNCTRSYEAYTENSSLFIAFPEGHVNGWASGDMWRYENGMLQRL